MMMGALSRQAAERLVEAAIAAPSTHNAQPWRFVARLADRTIEVYADPARTLRRGDPRGRAVHIACGAALFNLRLAITHAGAEPVTRLLPSPRDPLLLASVRLAGPYRARPSERDLYAAIGHARAPRAGTPSQPQLRSLLAALLEAAALEGASLRVLEQTDALRIIQSAAAADRALHPDAGYLAELRGFLPRPASLAAGGRLTVLPPQLAVIATQSDDRASWLRAGQAMQRVLLLAAHRGLPAAPLTPVLELPDTPLRPDPRLEAEHPEMIIRLGGDPAPASYRRPAAQVMRVISPVNPRQDEGPRAVPPPALPAGDRELMPSK
jgi:nitroreductase